MAAIHVAGVRCDPFGAIRWTQSNALQGTNILPEDDLLRSKHIGVPLNIFMYFYKINTLD